MNGLSPEELRRKAIEIGGGVAPIAEPEAFVRRAEMPQEGLLGKLLGALESVSVGAAGGEESLARAKQAVAGTKGDPLRALASRLLDVAVRTGPAILVSRIGGRTGAAREAIRRGEITGGMREVPSGRAIPKAEQFRRGLASVTGLPLPAPVEKRLGRVVAPAVGAVSDVAGALARTRPAMALRDWTSRMIGTEPGTPELREVHRRIRGLYGAEAEREAINAHEFAVMDETRRAISASTGLTGRELADAIALAQEEGHVAGTEGAKIAEKYPAIGSLARYLRYKDTVGRERLKMLTEAPMLGEAAMREAAERELTGEAASGQMLFDFAAKATKERPYTSLSRAHLGRLLTDEGARFFGIEGRKGSGRWIREVDLTLSDPASNARRLWPDLTLPEINRLAESGEAPGFEGKIAKGPIFEADPISVATAQAIWGDRLHERARFLLSLGKPEAKGGFGRSLGEFGETEGQALAAAEVSGYAPIQLPERSALRNVLDPSARARISRLEPKELAGGELSWKDRILLPRRIERHLRGTLAWVDPDGFLNRSGAVLRFWDAYQRIWAQTTLTPFLFPATTARNFMQEYGSSISAGVGPSMFGLATSLVHGNRKGVDEALRSRERIGSLEDSVAEWSRREDPFHGSEEAKALLGPGHASSERRFRSSVTSPGSPQGTFRILDDDPSGRVVSREASADELSSLAVRHGQLGLRRLHEIRFGISQEPDLYSQASSLRLLDSVLGPRDAELSTASRAQRRVERWVLHQGEEIPRLAQFLEGVLRRGLTPSESARWTNWYHLDMRRPMTVFERAVLRRFVPFYRWSRFNIPASLRIALVQPWIPAVTLEMMKALSSGTAEKELNPRTFPLWMRRQGAFFPMRLEKTASGRTVIHWITPSGSFSTMDLLDWFTSADEARRSTMQALNPLLRLSAALALGPLVTGKAVSARTGRELVGDTIYLGQRMPAWLAEQLDQWRFLNRLDHWITHRKDAPDIDLQIEAYNLVSPFRDVQTEPILSARQNAIEIRARRREGLEQARVEARRLAFRGASRSDVAARYRSRLEELAATLRELK